MSKLHTFLRTLDFVAGPVLLALGVPPALIPVIQHGIGSAEVVSADRPRPMTGAEKKQYVHDAVKTGIDAVNAVKPDALDPAIAGLVDKGIDVVVGTVNAIHKEPIA